MDFYCQLAESSVPLPQPPTMSVAVVHPLPKLCNVCKIHKVRKIYSAQYVISVMCCINIIENNCLFFGTSLIMTEKYSASGGDRTRRLSQKCIHINQHIKHLKNIVITELRFYLV